MSVKKALGIFARIVVSGGIILYIFTRQGTQPRDIIGMLRKIEPLYLLSALVVYKIIILAGILRWKFLMNAHNIDIDFWQIFKLHYIGLFFNNFMLSATGGDVVKAYYTSKLSDKKHELITTVVMDRLSGMSGLLCLGMAGGIVVGMKPGMFSVTAITIGVFCLFVFIGFFLFNRAFAKKLSFLVKWLPWKAALDTARKFYDTFYFYRSHKKSLFQALGLSIFIWSALSLLNYQLSLGFGQNLSLGYFFLLIPVVNIIGSIPISICGWGLREGAYAKFFGLVGMDSSVAVSLSICCGLIMLFWSLIGGVFHILHSPLKSERQ